MKRIVIHSKEYGVYLGSYLGLGFWSKLDPVGQDAAITFPSRDSAAGWLAAWDTRIDDAEFAVVEVATDDVGFVTVETVTALVKPGDSVYASIAECVAAGLPSWNPVAAL